jgi:hypothetical protein
MMLLVSNRHFHTASTSQFQVGWDSVVGIATLYALEFVVQNPVGMRFFTPVQKVPGARPVSCTMGTGSFTCVKRPECGIDHPPLYCSEVKKRAQIYLYSLSVPSLDVTG